jgi:hypothetical protein
MLCQGGTPVMQVTAGKSSLGFAHVRNTNEVTASPAFREQPHTVFNTIIVTNRDSGQGGCGSALPV